MIEANSVLRRLPGILDARQALFLDGIRHAAEITSFAYARLQRTLTFIASNELEQGKLAPHFTEAFLDAWAIVDAIDRFRTLWTLLPNATPRPLLPGEQSFAELSYPIRNLRNVADHLAQRADYVIARRGTALGSLSWFTALRPDGLEGVVCTIVPGTLKRGSFQTVNPAGRAIELPTDLIYLSAGEHRASLSEIIPPMQSRVVELERILEDAFKENGSPEQAGADLLIKLKIAFHDPVEGA